VDIQHLTIQGSNSLNEDALLVREGARVFAVLDGSTSLHPYRGPNGETGGYLASRLVRDALNALSDDELRHADLRQLVLDANAKLRAEMLRQGVDVRDKLALWTTCIALARVSETAVEYVQAGDCMIVAIYGDGCIRPLTRDPVAWLDREAKRVMEEARSCGISDRGELFAAAAYPTMQSNRRRMNTLTSYTVVSGEPELADLLESGVANRIDLAKLLLVTDGLFPPPGIQEEPFPWLAEQIEQRTLAGYADWLCALEAGDPDCSRYPRYKRSDDKTAIYITMSL
jgi:serine/threonine protein phosphatase PrpC